MGDQASKPFEIGLVMAGAVSAGAYTAGVIDFLFQALDEWHKAKERGDESAPTHEVTINVISGASAGGMTGAIISAMLNDAYRPITSLPGSEPGKEDLGLNRLYNSWVEQIDISRLLGDNDLQQSGQKVKSLLDSTVLDDIADKAIRFSGKPSSKPYIARQLHLYLTLTNLQGVPYDIRFDGRSGKGHTLSQHTDYLHFVLSDDDPELKESVWLNPADSGHDSWNLLKSAALATGAFPGGLAPRLVSRPFENYNHRRWPVPRTPGPDENPARCTKMETIKPAWPAHSDDTYHFLSVDGGVMDNEPMELARRQLAGMNRRNPREPEAATRAVIMIDPFPSEPAGALKQRPELEEYDIAGVFKGLFGSLMAQARFKPDALMLANSDGVYSRYLVAPTRYDQDGTKALHPIASGFLGGFGGFFSRKFRMHDFQLGRRNCQQFLKNYLSIPADKAEENNVMKGAYTEAGKKLHACRRNGTTYLPVIPLTGSAREEAFPIVWKTLKISEPELDDIRRQVKFRTKKVIGRLLDQYVGNSLARKTAKVIAKFKRNDIVDAIMKTITDDLDSYDLKR